LDLIDQMRVAIPDEVKKAQQVLSQRDRILAQSQEEANRTLALAREKSEGLVDQSAIVEAARIRVKEIEAEALREAEKTRREADNYVIESLSRLEMQLERSLNQARNGILALKNIALTPEVFEDELDKLDYSHTYDEDVYGKSLKQFAVDLGKESLKIKMSRGTYNINSAEVQDGIRSTAYLMGQMVRVNHMDSQIAREALRWAQLGLRAATEGDTKQDKADIDKMLFELEARDETVNADNSGIEQDEIIH